MFLTGASFVSLCKPSLLPAFRICPVSAPEFKFYTNHWRKTCKKTVFNVVLLHSLGHVQDLVSVPDRLSLAGETVEKHKWYSGTKC